MNAQRHDEHLADGHARGVDNPADTAAAPGTKALRYAELRLWFQDRDPTTDLPDETTGVMQDSLAETQRFAAAVLAAHYHGECGCQALAAGECNCPASLYGMGHADTCPRGAPAPGGEAKHCDGCGDDSILDCPDARPTPTPETVERVALLRRVEHVLVANWPTDPHTHRPGGGHVCDAECEQEYHYACLVNDVRAAIRAMGEGT